MPKYTFAGSIYGNLIVNAPDEEAAFARAEETGEGEWVTGEAGNEVSDITLIETDDADPDVYTSDYGETFTHADLLDEVVGFAERNHLPIDQTRAEAIAARLEGCLTGQHPSTLLSEDESDDDDGFWTDAEWEQAQPASTAADDAVLNVVISDEGQASSAAQAVPVGLLPTAAQIRTTYGVLGELLRQYVLREDSPLSRVFAVLEERMSLADANDALNETPPVTRYLPVAPAPQRLANATALHPRARSEQGSTQKKETTDNDHATHPD